MTVENEAELLRRTCVATKMLSVYAKWKGAGYLKATLQKVVERLMLTSKDLDLELDPARVSSPEDLQKNALQLRIVAKVFIDDICASSASIPPSFRKICSIVRAFLAHPTLNAKLTSRSLLRFPTPFYRDSRRPNTLQSALSYSSAFFARQSSRQKSKA